MAGIDTRKRPPDDVQPYAFGDMSEPERDAFDERLLEDDAAFYEAVDAENDLIDRYAAGQLSKTEAARFEKRLEQLPSLRASVENANAIREQIDHERPRKRPVEAAERNWLAGSFGLRTPLAGAAMSLALIAAVGLSIYFYVQARAARNELAQAKNGVLEQHIAEAQRDIDKLRVQVENAGAESDELVRSLNTAEQRNRDLEMELKKAGGTKPGRPADAPSIASLVLDAKDRDGATPTTTSVESATRKLAVSIELPVTAKADALFSVVLNGAPLGQGLISHAVEGGKRAITIMVPRDKLRNGENALSVVDASGQGVTTHTFRVDGQ